MANQLAKLMLAGILTLSWGGYSAEAQQVKSEVTQTVTCSGTVYDTSGEPILGASVLVKGTSKGTSTNIDGQFSIPGVKIGDEVQISFVGCNPYSFKVKSAEPVTVTLEENSTALNEVVVTALGMKRERKALGYAMTEIKGDDLNANLINPVSALQGKVAGVDINQSDGGLFGSNRIMIRGASTLGKNNQPIYVVDGIILDNANNDKEGDWDANNKDYGNELKNLNPADFESVSVLKGAAATALYGSRGLNGVVVITTKSGKGAKGYGVTFTQTLGCDWVTSGPRFQNIYGAGTIPGFIDYGESQWDWQAIATNSDGMRSLKQMNALGATESWGAPFDGQPIEYYDGSIRPYVAYPNNYKDAHRKGFNTTTNVAVTGGNEKTNFYMSMGYKYGQGTTERNDFSRFNFFLKASHQISKTVNVEGGVTFADSKPRNSPTNIGESFLGTFSRAWDPRDRKNYKGEHGGVASSAYGDPNGLLPGNGVWFGIYENDYTQKETVIRPNAKLTIEPLNWLRFTAEGSFNYYYTRFENKQPGANYRNEGGYYALGTTTKEQTNLNVNAYLNKDFNDFEIHAMARGEYYHSYAQSMSMNTDGGLVIPNKFFLANSKNPMKSTGELKGTKTMWSVMGQVGASWKGQVYLDVTARNDWSSSLVYSDGHGSFSYFYPSVSGSWLVNNTIKMPWWVTLGKVRASWAQVGNDTDPYTINQAYEFRSGQHNSNSIYLTNISTTAKSFNLKPEKKTSIEAGLEWRFVNNRFGFDVALYKENTKNQIMEISVPSVSGLKKQMVNAGNIQNKGIEVAINATPIQTSDWTWDMTFTYTHNSSKIISLHENVTDFIKLSGDPDYGNYRVGSVAKVGGAYGLIMTDSWAKIDEESGLPMLGILNGDYHFAHLYRSNEMKEVGDINPDFLGGFSTGLRYKNWHLNVALDCRFGGYVASYGTHYGTAYGMTEQSLRWRDEAHGGATYTSMWDGKTYHDGVIPDGIFAKGTVINYMNNGVNTAYTVGEGKYSTGETFAELMDKGIIEPQHSGSWQYWNNCWINVGNRRGVVSDDWFRKLNYISLREVSLSYTLPQNIASKIGSRGLSLTATGRNLGYLLNSLPNKENPEAVRGTNSHEFRIRSFMGNTASFTFTINATF